MEQRSVSPDPVEKERRRREVELLGKVADRSADTVVVDDQQTMRLILGQSLREIGFERVHRAPDGESALALMRERECGLALVDWNMPRMDGLELLDAVRADEDLTAMVYILVTAETQDVRVMQAAEESQDAYLTKPISSRRLARRLDLILSRRQALARAAMLEAAGSIDRAVEELMAASNNNPKAHWPLFHLGGLLARHGREDEAESCYQRVLEKDPEVVWALLELGRLRQNQGRIEQSRECFRRALEFNPSFLKAYDALAQSLLEQGDKGGALDVLEKVMLNQGTENAGRQEMVGRLRYEQGRFEGAEQAFEKALSLKPKRNKLSNNLGLGRSRLAQGKMEQALDALETAAEENNSSGEAVDMVDARLLLGSTYAHMGEMKKAGRIFEDLAELGSDRKKGLGFEMSDLHREVGNIYLRANKTEAARRHYAESVRLAPDDESNKAAIARHCKRAGVDDLSKAKPKPRPPVMDERIEAISKRGLILAKAGRLDEALEEYEKGLAIDPGAGRLLYNMGRVMIRNQDPRRALELVVDAARKGISRQDWDLVVEVARFFASQGRVAQAKGLVEKVLAEEPDHRKASQTLGELEALLAANGNGTAS